MKTIDIQIGRRSVDALIPYIRNARTHNDAQVAQIAASIREFGWTNPVLVDGENATTFDAVAREWLALKDWETVTKARRAAMS